MTGLRLQWNEMTKTDLELYKILPFYYMTSLQDKLIDPNMIFSRNSIYRNIGLELGFRINEQLEEEDDDEN